MGFKKPAEIVEAACGMSKIKVESPIRRILVLGFLGGAYTGFGAAFALVAGKGILLPEWIGLSKFLYGAVFPIGLIMSIIAGAELFAGNAAVVPTGCYKGVSSWSGLVKNLLFVWLGNLAGGIFMAFLIFGSGIFAKDPFLTAAKDIANAKASLPFLQAFLRGVGCNWLICLAVWMATAAEDVPGKIMAAWWPIAAFVTLNLENAVSNMFSIPLGILMGASQANWANFFTSSLLPVTLGNLVGGFVFVGSMYWWLYGTK